MWKLLLKVPGPYASTHLGRSLHLKAVVNARIPVSHILINTRSDFTVRGYNTNTPLPSPKKHGYTGVKRQKPSNTNKQDIKSRAGDNSKYSKVSRQVKISTEMKQQNFSGSEWFANSPLKHLTRMACERHIAKFKTNFTGDTPNGFICRIRIPWGHQNSILNLPEEFQRCNVMDEGFQGSGRSKPEATAQAALAACRFYESLGWLVNPKDAKGLQETTNAGKSAMTDSHYPAVKGSALGNLSYLEGDTKEFKDTAKSTFFINYQKKGYGTSDITYEKLRHTYGILVKATYALSPEFVAKLETVLSQAEQRDGTSKLSESNRVALQRIIEKKTIVGVHNNKKTAAQEAAVQGCMALDIAGDLNYVILRSGHADKPYTREDAARIQNGLPPIKKSSSASAGQTLQPLHYRLPGDHRKGEEPCKKKHDLPPEKMSLTQKHIDDIYIVMDQLKDAERYGLLKSRIEDLRPAHSPDMHLLDTARVYDHPVEGSELNRSNELKKNLDTYYHYGLPLQRSWGTTGDLIKTRQNLPIHAMREEILDVVNNNQVVVLQGETGCGKSTQVPQYLLEDMISRNLGPRAEIVVTQPRRISAISLAERVAAERAERLGVSTGYKIRLENKPPTVDGSILFCTTGVFLRMLADPASKTVTHLVIDEIHERDLQSDYLITALRDLLPKRPDLRVILMSATLQAKLFADYFNSHHLQEGVKIGQGKPAPIISVPGRTFPVTRYSAEDVLAMTGYNPVPDIEAAKPGNKNRKGGGGGGGIKPEKLLMKAPVRSSALATFPEKGIKVSSDLDRKIQERLAALRTGLLPMHMIAATIQHICNHEPEGAILCFLPGWDEIKTISNLLEMVLPRSDGFRILPLHSRLSSADQREIFSLARPGIRKIVLSTNIAETSVTINDCVYVVDSGRHKEMSYDPEMGINALQMSWVSRAACNQRAGRAGRVRPGKYYSMVPKAMEEHLMPQTVPEIKRAPLDDIILNIKHLRLASGDVRSVLSKALESPTDMAIEDSLDSLVDLGALSRHITPGAHPDDPPTKTEELTPLGEALVKLPLDAKLGKMLVYAVLLRCADPILTVAAAMSAPSPWLIVPEHQRNKRDQLRLSLADDWQSDHVALINAFNGYEAALRHGDDANYCAAHYLNRSNMRTIAMLKRRFANVLERVGFPITRASNMYSSSTPLIKAVVLSGLYPNVIRVVNPIKGAKAKAPKFFCDDNCGLTPMPGSVTAGEKHFNNRWLAYTGKLKISSVYADSVSSVSTAALLLLCGSPEMIKVHDSAKGDRFALVVAGWIVVEMSEHDCQMMMETWSATRLTLMNLIADTKLDFEETHVNNLVYSIANLIHHFESGSDVVPDLRKDPEYDGDSMRTISAPSQRSQVHPIPTESPKYSFRHPLQFGTSATQGLKRSAYGTAYGFAPSAAPDPKRGAYESVTSNLSGRGDSSGLVDEDLLELLGGQGR